MSADEAVRVYRRREESRYRDHPQVTDWQVDDVKTSCYVSGVAVPRHHAWYLGLYVRELFDVVLVDDPGGSANRKFGTLDEGIEWALSQAGGPS